MHTQGPVTDTASRDFRTCLKVLSIMAGLYLILLYTGAKAVVMLPEPQLDSIVHRSRRHSADSPGTRPPWRRPTASLCCALPPAPASPVATWMRTRAPERHPVVPSRDLLGIASFEWPRSGPFQNIPLVGLEQRWKHLELAASTGNTRETESSVCLRAFEREQQRASERGTKVFG